jgi:hypothetical protein
MTEYNFTSTTEPPISSHAEVKERKEKRRKQLAAVFQRRREIYKRYLKKLQMQGAKR